MLLVDGLSYRVGPRRTEQPSLVVKSRTPAYRVGVRKAVVWADDVGGRKTKDSRKKEVQRFAVTSKTI